MTALPCNRSDGGEVGGLSLATATGSDSVALTAAADTRSQIHMAAQKSKPLSRIIINRIKNRK